MKVGDTVSWSSQARSYRTEKEGRIVEVLPAGEWFQSGPLCTRYNAKSAYGGGTPRDHESYIVLVQHSGKGKPTLYWPLVSGLKLIKEAA